ncbi:MAG TPA: HNH endonuclease signature motif containing protein [Rhodothermales bacterium]|nr:HNH endonuclease signature motif containing protein [Rhodothermales bacterium]
MYSRAAAQPRRPRLALACGYCGVAFTRTPSAQARASGTYCSIACSGKGRRRAVMLPCTACGVPVRVEPGDMRRSKTHYCSSRCQGRVSTTRVVRTCDFCGAKYSAQGSHARRGVARFCSRPCHDNARRIANNRRYRSVVIDGRKVLEHRWVMEQVLGRPLRDDEVVDHINRCRRDNRPSNLRVLSREEHGLLSNDQVGTPFQATFWGFMKFKPHEWLAHQF